MNKKNTKIIVIAVCILAVLIAAFALISTYFSPNPDRDSKGTEETPENLKIITVKVVLGDGTEKTFEAKTEGNSLRDALESIDGLITGEEGPYGLFVTAVDGVTADSSKQEWWCFTRGGETLVTSIDDTVIANGETYEITLTTGY